MGIKKINLKNYIYTTLLFVILSLASWAQKDVVIENLSVSTELPKGAINKLEQDNAGFIWLGTWKGLYRYDGYKVVNFSTINSKFNALKIKGLLINGNDLWVATFVSGLFRIDLSTYEVYSYLKESEPSHRISENNIISLCALPDHTIFVGTERAGFNIIDAQYNVVKSYTLENAPHILSSNQVSKIIAWDDETVILGSNSLSFFNYKSEELNRIDHPILNKHIAEIGIISPNQLIVSTLDGTYSVYLENPGVRVEQILDHQIRSVIKNINSDDDTYLLATFNGIIEYNVKSKELRELLKEHNENQRMDVNQLFVTQDKTILIGSETGLYSMFQRNIHFEHISSNTTSENPDIISKIEYFKDKLYAGSWGKGVLSFDEKEKHLVPAKFSNYNNPLPRFIYSMESFDDKVWFSSKNQKGIFSFNSTREPIELTYYPTFRSAENELLEYTVICSYKTQNKTMLVGTWDGLLFYYHEANDEFIVIKDSEGNLPLSKDISMNSIMEDSDGFIWIALGGGGVLKLKIENQTIVYQELITTQQGLVSNFVTTIFQSRNNKIWFGTEAGLSIYENKQFKSYFNKDIIFDLQSITEDPIGFLWIGTQKGILRLNSNHVDEPYKLFDTSDGLSNGSFYLNSLYAANDYTLYFGGLNGIDYFIPYKIEYNFNKPIPKITSFSLFNEEIYPTNFLKNKILEKNIGQTNEIILTYNQNTFAIEFSNLEYHLQEKCQFSYMLEGVDIDWNFKDANHRYANYTKLSPGNYTFQLKSTNNDGVWCDEPVLLKISIEPPYWASTWAYIIYFIAAMFSIFSIIYNRLMKVHNQHRQQIKELEFQKQKELDELKLRFFTNISHEFRTPLTLILGPLAKILENDKNNPYKEKHLMIFRNASRLLQLTNRIMDFRKSDNEQLKLKVELTNISEFIYNIFLFFNYEAQKRNIDYRFKTNIEGSIYVDQEFLESITFNLLSNAFKYTPDGKSIYITVSGDDTNICISFTDTGKGIKADKLQYIFDRFYTSTQRNSAGIGLSFTKRLVELHKGGITVESEFGKGSTFTLTLPANDIYTEAEKSTIANKETIVDWKKIDQSVKLSVNDDLNQLKNIYKRDEMIALVVDDNFEVRQFIISLLQTDFEVIEASNGKEALEKAYLNIPDIVISDVMMPEMDGFELCRILKSDPRTDHIPVILTTVLSSQADRIEGLNEGADSYITKPIDPKHLMVRVKKLIEKQLKLKDKFNLQNINIEPKNIEEPKQELHPLVEKAHNIVLQNLDNSEYNIDDFCSDLGLSRMQLYRKFKAITGLSANSFIRKVRLHKAAEMLKTGTFTVKEVTYDVGFIDLKYFRKCFNEEFGVNPSEYAKNAENS